MTLFKCITSMHNKHGTQRKETSVPSSKAYYLVAVKTFEYDAVFPFSAGSCRSDCEVSMFCQLLPGCEVAVTSPTELL